MVSVVIENYCPTYVVALDQGRAVRYTCPARGDGNALGISESSTPASLATPASSSEVILVASRRPMTPLRLVLDVSANVPMRTMGTKPSALDGRGGSAGPRMPCQLSKGGSTIEFPSQPAVDPEHLGRRFLWPFTRGSGEALRGFTHLLDRHLGHGHDQWSRVELIGNAVTVEITELVGV